MRRFSKLSPVIILIFSGLSLIIASCTLVPLFKGAGGRGWSPPRPVTIVAKGARGAINNSLPEWIAQSDGKTPITVLARDGDIIFIEPSKKDNLFFPYVPADGANVSVRRDGSWIILGDQVIGIGPSDGPELLDAINGANPERLAGLRICGLENGIDPANPRVDSTFQKLARINPNMGWIVGEPEELRYILRLFDPRWLFINDDMELDENDLVLISQEPALEYLRLNAKKLNSLKGLSCPKKLRRLTMQGWDPGKTGPLNGDWKPLNSLTVLFSPIKDISGMAQLKGIHELHFVSCEDLSDISALSGFSQLKALGFSRCKDVADLSVLRKLEELQWLSLPPGTTHDQFQNIINDHPDLRVLQLIKCENIKDLSPLGGLHKLESLVLLGHRPDYHSLSNIKSLRFVAFPEASFEEQARVSDLQKALPHCLIVQAEPFCLGSGWILLLWPALLPAWLLTTLFSKKGNNGSARATGPLADQRSLL